jgi:hypothetical protein
VDSTNPPASGDNSEAVLPEGLQILLAHIAANCTDLDEEWMLMSMLGLFDAEE